MNTCLLLLSTPTLFYYFQASNSFHAGYTIAFCTERSTSSTVHMVKLHYQIYLEDLVHFRIHAKQRAKLFHRR